MKKFMTLGGVVVLMAALAYPAFARGPGGNWGGGPGNCPNYSGVQSNLSEEQQKQLTELNKKFFDNTSQFRSQMWTKRGEFQALMSSPNPDPEKAKALQKELSDLRAKMEQDRLAYSLEARKINPDARYEGGFGPGYGRGHGRGMGWGRSMGPGGYGPGGCH